MGRKNEATRDRFELKKVSQDPSYKRVYGNYPAKKYKKGTPAITRLEFEMVGSATKFIDVAAALSALNRKMYRQGCYYYVNSIEYYDNLDSYVDVLVLPDTWTTRAAYRRAKGIFDQMNDMALRHAQTVVPKYHDFKVYMSDQHRANGSTPVFLHGINQAAVAIDNDEWAYSQLVSQDDDQDGVNNADEFYLHMIGGNSGSSDNWTSVGVIASYGNTRVEAGTSVGQPVVPTTLATDPLVNLFDASSEEQLNDVLTNLDEDNDLPPYDRNLYVGESSNHMHHVGRLTTTAESGRVTQGAGFCAPLGLICIDPPTGSGGMPSDNEFRIVLNLAVGTYHGVYAERIA